jgi:hypothetical protein
MSHTHRTAWRLAPLVALLLSCCALAADPAKVLHVASPDIETLDPHQYDDDPSFQIIATMFEGLYEWDYLAATPTLAPVTAAGPPQISADGLTWTVPIKPGVYLTDDPAFKGRPRERVLALTLSLLWKKNLEAIGLRSDFPITPFEDVIKELGSSRCSGAATAASRSAIPCSCSSTAASRRR